MENGDRQGEDHHQHQASNDLPAQRPQPQWQHTNGKHDERSDNADNTKPNQKRRHLSGRSFFCVPVHADPSAHFLCCPPGQQVLELQWRPHITNPVKCSDEMENGFTVHVLGHVVQSSPDLVLVLFIKCRRVCVVNQLTNSTPGTTMLRRIFDGTLVLSL